MTVKVALAMTYKHGGSKRPPYKIVTREEARPF